MNVSAIERVLRRPDAGRPRKPHSGRWRDVRPWVVGWYPGGPARPADGTYASRRAVLSLLGFLQTERGVTLFCVSRNSTNRTIDESGTIDER